MRFDFFTLGGSQFWEDVFFYQKWRIQRNYKTKQYRLLDNWDIRRAEGRFENCRRAFLKYIEVFQLSRQVFYFGGISCNRYIQSVFIF